MITHVVTLIAVQTSRVGFAVKTLLYILNNRISGVSQSLQSSEGTCR